MFDRVGAAVIAGDVRRTGLRATGGGTFFDVELVVDVERRWSAIGD